MKSYAMTGLLLSLAGLAAAQMEPAVNSAAELATQRTAIATERAKLEAGFLTEDAACYKRFAVNKCLEEVNARRMSAMMALRRQEISLSDEERKSKAAEQIRKIDEKSLPESIKQEGDRRAKATDDFRERQLREQESAARRKAAEADATAARQAGAARLQAHQQKAQARAQKQADAAEEAKKFEERQAQSRARRAQHEADLANRAKPAAKPLPVPPL